MPQAGNSRNEIVAGWLGRSALIEFATADLSRADGRLAAQYDGKHCPLDPRPDEDGTVA